MNNWFTRPTKIWQCIIIILIIAIITSVPLFFTMGSENTQTMALAVVVGNLLALALVYLILKKSKINLSLLVRIPQGNGLNALFLVLCMGILTIGGILIYPSVFIGTTISYVSDIVLAPICEETLYRYIFFCGLLVTFKSPIKVIIITSILFGLTHFNSIGHIIDTTLMGVVLGFTYWRTQSLITCILMHSFSNIIIILFIVKAK